MAESGGSGSGSGGGIDLENPSPSPSPAAGMAASSPNDPHNTAAGAKDKTWKVIALSVYLVAAVVLAIALGVTLGGNRDDGGAALSQGANAGGGNDAAPPPANDDPAAPKTPAPVPVPPPPAANNDDESPVPPPAANEESEESPVPPPAANDDGSPAGSPPASDEDAPDGDDEDEDEEMATFDVRYLESPGRLAARVRIANPGVARGYASCNDLKDDILNALKYYAYSTIVNERDNGWFRYCDIGEACARDGACRTGNCTDGVCARYIWEPGTPSSEPTYGMTPTVGYSITMEDSGASAKAPASIPAEDSFDTNAQVDGVDEADVVKANADHVFAAYGDILWVWNSTGDASSSGGKMSKTQMPAEPRDPNCTDPTPWPTPSSNRLQPLLRTPYPTLFPTPAPALRGMNDAVGSNDGSIRRRRRDSSFPGRPWYHGSCEPPKPEILALLLEGPRLAAIVSKPDHHRKTPYLEGEEDSNAAAIIGDETMIVRVYDAANIPADGGPLTLLGEREIRGSYTSARSIGSKGVVISKLTIDKWSLVEDLRRYNLPYYCGLNRTEYEELATETALGLVDSMAERMIAELELPSDDGTCDNWFQIAAMQAGNSTDAKDGDFLDELVQVSSFDMSSDFAGRSGDGDGDDGHEPPKIPVASASVFTSGSSRTVYASRDFVASVNVGYEYDPTSRDWASATFVQAFDIGGAAPRPFGYAEVPGRPLNQYSLDLYENHLRVVTTQSRWWPERWTENKLWVLKVPERGRPEAAATNPEMELTGETGHLGKPNEEVFAVRFMGDLAYVVTFEQTDPFYVLNVTNHTNPIVIGELQIPGFSSYLHPIQIDGVEMMIGVGEHVDPESGRSTGAKISLFDVSDPMNPTENATYVDPGAYSSATSDFYSFRYLNLNQKLILPKSEWTWRREGNFDGFVIYDIDLGSIASSYEIEHADSEEIYSWCGYGPRMPARSLVFRSQLTTILSHSVISTDLATGAQNWNASLDEGLEKTKDCRGYFW